MIYSALTGSGRHVQIFDLNGEQITNVVEADTTDCHLTEIVLRKPNSTTSPLYCKWEQDEKGDVLYRRFIAEFDVVHRESGQVIDRARFVEVPRGSPQP